MCVGAKPGQLIVGKGNHSWSDGTTQFLYIPKGNEMYTHHYFINKEAIPAGGSLTVTNMGKDDKFIKGHVILDPACYVQIGEYIPKFGIDKGALVFH